jgi:hypothetical protein
MPDERTPGTALALPEDVKADLLRAQMSAIGTTLELPRVKIMAAGVGMYEFTDGTNETVREFSGVILGSHARNVLWDKKFGSARSDDDEKFPACSSRDGITGIPRAGFEHAALSGPAEGTETIDCATCPYNQWGTGNLLIADKNPKGKATTNQRSVYILTADRRLPVELVLPPTSITAFDEYMGRLLNRSTPVQAVVTKFTQKVTEKGSLKWANAIFTTERPLTQEEFNDVLETMTRFRASIDPSVAGTAPASGTVSGLGGTETDELDPDAPPRALDAEDDDLPF